MTKVKPIENAIYKSIVSHCRELQKRKVYLENGNALAHTLSMLVAEGLLSDGQKKIYDVLSDERKSAKEIAKKVGISSKQVSAQLIQIYQKTDLVGFSWANDKNKLWHKNNI